MLMDAPLQTETFGRVACHGTDSLPQVTCSYNWGRNNVPFVLYCDNQILLVKLA